MFVCAEKNHHTKILHPFFHFFWSDELLYSVLSGARSSQAGTSDTVDEKALWRGRDWCTRDVAGRKVDRAVPLYLVFSTCLPGVSPGFFLVPATPIVPLLVRSCAYLSLVSCCLPAFLPARLPLSLCRTPIFSLSLSLAVPLSLGSNNNSTQGNMQSFRRDYPELTRCLEEMCSTGTQGGECNVTLTTLLPIRDPSPYPHQTPLAARACRQRQLPVDSRRVSRRPAGGDQEQGVRGEADHGVATPRVRRRQRRALPFCITRRRNIPLPLTLHTTAYSTAPRVFTS